MPEELPTERPDPGRPAPRQPERAEGPTPAGGAYSIAYYGPDDRIAEIVEFDAMDRAIRRTYCADSRAFETSGPEAEDLTRGDRPGGDS